MHHGCVLPWLVLTAEEVAARYEKRWPETVP